ncbi:Ubiquinone biosynthesis O-methyltransferase [Bremerella volcania]|uniref:Ubiquinone biosynthesis O-methyltransferase n=1 Tax=Bremerella volcania TaxID=2527984 RepID=A0A518CF91_9BACT|nr:class I SAM-dependent methyltransferase [Bremerella volcania]QDU77900.1 Ubiquinone biosynthesis O-methyltransferase [Bremerella volcania]
MTHRVFHAWDGSNGEIGTQIDAQAACPISGQHAAVVICDRDRYGYPLRTVISQATGLVYTDPRADNDTIDDFYRSTYRRFYKSASQPKWKHTARNAFIANQRVEMIKTLVTKGAAVLDVGTGSGELLYVGRRHGLEMQGIEVDQTYAQFGRKSYGVKIINESLRSAVLPKEHFDVVTIFHVLEHLPDPQAALAKIWTTLKPGGCVLVEVPNVESLDTRFHQKWHPGHLYHFNCGTLSALAATCGFVTATVHTCERRSVVGALLGKPWIPIEVDWQPIVAGNFEKTWDLLQFQAQQNWYANFYGRLGRARHKFKRNLREWTLSLSEGNRRRLVDKVTRNRAA